MPKLKSAKVDELGLPMSQAEIRRILHFCSHKRPYQQKFRTLAKQHAARRIEVMQGHVQRLNERIGRLQRWIDED